MTHAITPNVDYQTLHPNFQGSKTPHPNLKGSNISERLWLLRDIERDLLETVARIMTHLREDEARDSASSAISVETAHGSYRGTRRIEVRVSDARAWTVVEGQGA